MLWDLFGCVGVLYDFKELILFAKHIVCSWFGVTNLKNKTKTISKFEINDVLLYLDV